MKYKKRDNEVNEILRKHFNNVFTESGLTIEQLAGIMKVSPAYTGDLLRGRTSITSGYQERFCNALMVNQDVMNKIVKNEIDKMTLDRLNEITIRTRTKIKEVKSELESVFKLLEEQGL